MHRSFGPAFGSRPFGLYVRVSTNQYSWPIPDMARAPYVPSPPNLPGRHSRRRVTVKILKMQAFRVLLVLSAIASSALVLQAGQRWGGGS
jgi:hypothetical protein